MGQDHDGGIDEAEALGGKLLRQILIDGNAGAAVDHHVVGAQPVVHRDCDQAHQKDRDHLPQSVRPAEPVVARHQQKDAGDEHGRVEIEGIEGAEGPEGIEVQAVAVDDADGSVEQADGGEEGQGGPLHLSLAPGRKGRCEDEEGTGVDGQQALLVEAAAGGDVIVALPADLRDFQQG